MRIKFLKTYVNPAGDDYAEGSFLNVEDDKLAKRYVAAGIAEEAPEADASDPVALMKGLVADIVSGVRAEIRAAGTGKGPDIRGGESEHDRKKSFGHQLQLIGVASNDQTEPRAREEAHNLLKNLYQSGYRPWTGEDVVKAGSTQVESSGPLGGYGVFPEYSANLYKIAIEATILGSRAKKVPMASNTMFYPKLDQTGTQAAGASGYLGGIVLWWQGEQAGLNKTNALLKQGELKAGKLQGYTQISMETISDNSIGLEAQLTDLIRDGVAYYVDLATLVGDGVDKPQGVVGAAATLAFNRAGGAGTATIAFGDLTGMKRRLLPQYRRNAFWAVTLGMEDALWNIVDGSGRTLFLPNFPGTVGGPVTADVGSGVQNILGLPYEVTEKLPAFGTKGDIMLIAPQAYMLGERMSLEITASNAPGFLSGLMTYRFIARVAGQPILDKPFTLLDGATQASTFVALN